ncbi:MAG: lipopolysaccharide kinase InaA family protein, partial [Halanaerobiaceae bacterium]
KILKNQLRPAEGERHFKTACRLQECGIPVVDPVMGIIRRINFYLTESIYVTREFPGVNLIEFLQQEECAPDFRCEIIKEVAKIWSRLINNKFLHQDPSLLNVLINRREDNYELALVDIENVYSLRFFPQLLFRKNMVKFSARVLSDFIRYELEDLSLKERYLFYRVILDKLDKDIDFKKFWCRITSDTRKRLLHRDSVNVVDADRYLNEKRNRF